MKKLMTLLSAAAVAFGLQAADTGTSFEGMDAGDLDITSSTGELAEGTSGYWETNGNAQVSLKVVNGISRQHIPAQTQLWPSQYAGEDQERYLEVSTPFGNPAARHVKSNGSGQSIDTGFYFDSLVKFTAFDEDPMTTAVTNDFEGAKIAVWVKEVCDANEVVVGTNLYVRAGSLGGDPQTYNCGRLRDPDAWHRLTIKAIRSIYKGDGEAVPGFVVFVDNAYRYAVYPEEYALTGIVEENLADAYSGFYGAAALFPSMVQGDPSATYLSSVSFDGKGEVDDLVFTDTVPFDAAKDARFVTVSWDADDVEAISIDGEAKTVSDEVAKLIFTSSFTPAISVTYKEGKLAGTWTGTATIEGETVTFDEADQTCVIVADDAAASFKGVPYADLADAVDAANATTVPSVPSPVLKLFGTTSKDEIAIETANGEVAIELDLNGQTVGAITGLTPLSIVDSVGTGVVEGEVYFDASGSIAAGTYKANVSFGAAGAITGGKFLASENTASELNPFAPQGKEFVEGTGDDTGYLVLGNEAVKYTIKFISGEGSTTNEYEIAAGAAVNAPTAAEVVGKEFSAWDPAVVTPAAADATYTAVYTYTQYTITYKNADGTAFTSWAQNYAAPNSFTIERAVALPGAEDVELGAVGVSFESWTNAVGTVVASTQGLTANLEVFAKLVSGGSGGWVADPAQIDQGKTAAQQYPALAKSPLAGTDAKALTTWAQSQTDSVSIADVANAAEDSDIYDAYLLNCDVGDVEDARADFVPSISIVDGVVTVTAPTAPQGGFNGTLNKKGSADLEHWYDANTNEGYNFFKYELVP